MHLGNAEVVVGVDERNLLRNLTVVERSGVDHRRDGNWHYPQGQCGHWLMLDHPPVVVNELRLSSPEPTLADARTIATADVVHAGDARRPD